VDYLKNKISRASDDAMGEEVDCASRAHGFADRINGTRTTLTKVDRVKDRPDRRLTRKSFRLRKFWRARTEQNKEY